MSSSDIQFQIINDNLNINEGSIMENMFAAQLKSNGYMLYYYDKKKVGELDFVIEYGSKLLPIEIKSGKNYKKYPALHNILQNKDYKITKPIVFCIGNIENQENILYLPLYMIMYVKDEHKLGVIELNLKI